MVVVVAALLTAVVLVGVAFARLFYEPDFTQDALMDEFFHHLRDAQVLDALRICPLIDKRARILLTRTCEGELQCR